MGDVDRRVVGHRRGSVAVAPAAGGARQRNAPAARRGMQGRSRFAQGRASRTRSQEPRSPPRVCAADRGSPGVVAGVGHVGRMARSLRRARADGAAPARARAAAHRAVAADVGDWSRESRRGAGSDCRSPADAGRAIRPRSRYGRVFVASPHQARGRAFRVVFVAGLAERMFPQRPHEDPMLLDAEMRRASRRGSRAAGRPRENRAVAPPARRRRGVRAAVAVVSASGDGRVPSARAELLCARRHARRDGPHPAAPAAPGVGSGGRAAPASPGRHPPRPPTRSTISNTTSRSCGSCSRPNRGPPSGATATIS